MHRHRRPTLLGLVWAILLTQAVGHATDGWLLPGLDDVAERRPELASALHRAADAARVRAGRPPTGWDDGLARAARQHAAELAARGLLDHGSPTPGRHTLGDRLARAGSPYTTHAENLAFVPNGHDPVRATIDGWLGSPPHRENLLAPGYDRVGFGTASDANGGLYLVQVLAAAPWAPDAWSATPIEVETTSVALGLQAERALTALIEIAGAAHVVDLERGWQRWVTEVAVTGAWQVRIGVLTRPPDGFTLDEAGEVANSGRWRPGAAPRSLLQVSAAEAARGTHSLVRLTVDAAAAPAGWALIVDGRHRPEASSQPGRLQLDLSVTEAGPLLLALAEPDGRGRLLVRHGFSLQRSGTALLWAARP